MNKYENNRRDDFYSDDPDVIERRATEYENRYNGYRDEYDNYGYQGAGPVSSSGRPVKNRFGLKLTLAIIFTLLTGPLGIAAIVFTALQNSAYKNQRWDNFRTFRILSNILLVLSGIVSVLIAFFAGIMIWTMIMISRDGDLLESMKQYMLHDEDMQILVEEILGDDGLDTVVGLMDRMEENLGESSEEELWASEGSELWNLPEIDVPDMYNISINDYDLTAPMNVGHFLEATGEELSGDGDDFWRDAGEMEIWMESGHFYLYITDMNGDEELDMEDVVDGFDYEVFEGDHFSWIGLDQDSNLADVLAVLGDDCEITDLAEFDMGMQYCWMTETGWLIVCMKEDRIAEVSILNMTH